MTTTTLARAWSVRRSDGLTLGFTDHDEQLVFGGITFRPDHGLTARSLAHGTGLAVDNSEAVGALSDDAINERDLMAGRWDRAELRMWEVDWKNVERRRLVFCGSLGEISCANGSFRAELRGLSESLNVPQGRVYHPRCCARLGDNACKIDMNAESLMIECQIKEMEDGRVFGFSSFPVFDSGWFENGRLEVTSGTAKGLHGTVKNDIVRPGGYRNIELWFALGVLPAPGDIIRLTAGCDKSARTCRLKFFNFPNFRGFPHLPSEDWLMAPGAVGNNG